MILAQSVIRLGLAPGPFADTITLDEAMRRRRRMAMVSDGGIAFLLDIADAGPLRQGDAIVLDDGRLVEVRVPAEPLLAISGRDAAHLALLAWHLGNLHVSLAIEADRLLVRQDGAIAELVRGLGGVVAAIDAGFDPVVDPHAGGHASQAGTGVL